jgi:hypothetical protein
MPRVRTYIGALLVGASFLIAGCSDLPTAPQAQAAPTPSYGLLGTLLGSHDQDQATVLERTVPLAQDEVVSQVIGRWGGVIRLPQAGLTVSVPFGALSSPTEITVTAPAGNLVGYHFEPHGLQFARAVTVSQDLLSTKGLRLTGMRAVYFDGDLKPTVTPLESLPLWLLRILGVFQIHHFSGYVIATN